MTYKIGNIFTREETGEQYLLSYCGNNKLALINIKTGMWWTTSKRAKNYNEVTEKEFNKMTEGHKFSKSEIKITNQNNKTNIIKERI